MEVAEVKPETGAYIDGTLRLIQREPLHAKCSRHQESIKSVDVERENSLPCQDHIWRLEQVVNIKAELGIPEFERELMNTNIIRDRQGGLDFADQSFARGKFGVSIEAEESKEISLHPEVLVCKLENEGPVTDYSIPRRSSDVTDDLNSSFAIADDLHLIQSEYYEQRTRHPVLLLNSTATTTLPETYTSRSMGQAENISTADVITHPKQTRVDVSLQTDRLESSTSACSKRSMRPKPPRLARNLTRTADKDISYKGPLVHQELPPSYRPVVILRHLTKSEIVSATQRKIACDKVPSESRKQQSANVHLSNPNKCDVCGRKFSTKKKRDRHLQVIHCVNLFLCPKCHQNFSKACELREHKRLVCFKSDIPRNICDNEPSKSGKQRSINLHLSNPNQCCVCGKKFSFKKTRDRHLLVIHGVNPFLCPKCHQSFNKACELREHKRLVCFKSDKPRQIQKNGPFKCKFCERVFGGSNNRDRHMELLHAKRKPFCCEVCKKTFKQRSALRDHMLIACKKKKWLASRQCKICKLILSCPHSLRTHISTVHNGERPYSCHICHQRFSGKASLDKHILNHAGQKPYQCDVCGRCFSGKEDLKYHLVTHSGERNFECQICHRKYFLETKLKQHIRISHPHEKRFFCETCQKSFSTSARLKGHKLVHLPKQFRCNICPKAFRREFLLNNHIRAIHTGEINHSCDFCHKRFESKYVLKEHRSIHTGERNFECEVCQRPFRLRSDLNKHRLIHTAREKKFRCEVCNYAFRDLKSLKRHGSIHTSDKKFKCEVCDYAFRLQSNLNRHKSIHTGERKFKCKDCGRKFRLLVGLNKHKSIHTGEKNYKCEICQKTFRISDSLRLHMKTHS